MSTQASVNTAAEAQRRPVAAVTVDGFQAQPYLGACWQCDTRDRDRSVLILGMKGIGGYLPVTYPRLVTVAGSRKFCCGLAADALRSLADIRRRLPVRILARRGCGSYRDARGLEDCRRGGHPGVDQRYRVGVGADQEQDRRRRRPVRY
jgi:hypothetical protein